VVGPKLPEKSRMSWRTIDTALFMAGLMCQDRLMSAMAILHQQLRSFSRHKHLFQFYIFGLSVDAIDGDQLER
jgi:hypothetical protein